MNSDVVMVKTSTRRVRRREILGGVAAAVATGVAGPATWASAGGIDALRVGLIGCGERGTDAAGNCVAAAPGVRIMAMGDLFADQLKVSCGKLEKLGADKFDVPNDRRFVGFDAYAKVLAAGVDLVILATPPHFRPAHLAAAVKAGVHVFMEKPAAVDPAGVRSVIASAKLAAQKKLCILAGTQRRHQDSYIEVVKRVHGGAIGPIVGGQCYWNTGSGREVWERRAGATDMEYQLRNWMYYTWLSGDHIVEQHVHNLDAMNWAMQAHPVGAVGIGGRQVRTGKEYGNVYDHFAVEFEYPGGIRITSMCRQQPDTSTRVGERVVGTKGVSNLYSWIEGAQPYEHKGRRVNPYVQEHADLIESIRKGKPINEAQQLAESTMTAILGRMAAYTGRAVSWKPPAPRQSRTPATGGYAKSNFLSVRRQSYVSDQTRVCRSAVCRPGLCARGVRRLRYCTSEIC